MKYTTYVIMNVIIGVVGFLFLSWLYLSVFGRIGVGIGIGFVAIMGLALLFAFALSLAWVRRAVTEYGGVPMPGIWGILGVMILPDEWSSRPDRSEEPYDRSVIPEDDLAAMTNNAADPDTPDWIAASQPPKGGPRAEVPRTSTPLPVPPPRYECVHCGQVTEGSNSKFCRVCGNRLAT